MPPATTTLDLVQRLYIGLEERDPYPPMLAVLISAFRARQAFVAVLARGDARFVVGAVRGLDPLAVDPAVHDAAWRALSDGPRFRPGVPHALRAAVACEGEVAVLAAQHAHLGASIWVVARAEPFGPDDAVCGAVLAANLDHAGHMALARGRAPKGSELRTRTGDYGPLVRPLVGRTSTGDLGPSLRARLHRPTSAIRKRVTGLCRPDGPSAPPGPLPAVARDLSPRALACARLAARGKTDDEIADTLRISTSTVSRHLQAAYRAFGVRGRRELNIIDLLGDG
jgi:DNA-binding CsgD family transcriptional regulator